MKQKINYIVLSLIALVCAMQQLSAAGKVSLAPRYDSTRLYSDNTEHEHLMHRTRNRYRFLPYARYWPWHRSWNMPWKSYERMTPKFAPVQPVQEVKEDTKAQIDAVGVAVFARQTHDMYPVPQRTGISLSLLLLFFILSAAGLALIMTRRRVE